MTESLDPNMVVGNSYPGQDVLDWNFEVHQRINNDGSVKDYIIRLVFNRADGDRVAVSTAWDSPLGRLFRSPDFAETLNQLREMHGNPPGLVLP